MSAEQEMCDNQKFSEKPVCKFLDGNHHFYNTFIPERLSLGF